MALTKSTTWVGYFAALSKKKQASSLYIAEQIEENAGLFNQAYTILNHSVPMIYLLDYTTGQYSFVSNHCQAHLGFSFEKMIDGGVDFVIDRYHPRDLHLFNEEIFPDRLQILKKIPVAQHKDYIFSLNYRIKDGEGKWVNLLQRNAFIQSDENGNPLLSMGVVTNINHFKEEEPVVQIVEKVNCTGKSELIYKNTYYLSEEYRRFTRREKEILPLLADGLTSKEIADRLFISEHTVINHKRHMHEKSNTHNTPSLISFAIRNRLL